MDEIEAKSYNSPSPLGKAIGVRVEHMSLKWRPRKGNAQDVELHLRRQPVSSESLNGITYLQGGGFAVRYTKRRAPARSRPTPTRCNRSQKPPRRRQHWTATSMRTAPGAFLRPKCDKMISAWRASTTTSSAFLCLSVS